LPGTSLARARRIAALALSALAVAAPDPFVLDVHGAHRDYRYAAPRTLRVAPLRWRRSHPDVP
jgi:hypothetical protein